MPTRYPTISRGYMTYDTTGSQAFPRVGQIEHSVIEDFERSTLAVYGDDTSAFRIQGSNVLEGRYSLEGFVPQRTIGTNSADISTPRGTKSDPLEYKSRMVLASDGQASLLVCTQSANSPWSNSYVLLVDTRNDRIRLLRRQSGGTTNHETAPVSQGLSTGTEYQPAITLSDAGIKGTLYNSSGNVIVETDVYEDQVFSTGGLGWHNGIGDITYFDYATVQAVGEMTDPTEIWIEDFEDRNLSEYWIRDTGGTVAVTPGAAMEGSYGLDMNGFTSIQTAPGRGHENYIRNGEPVQVSANFRNLGTAQYWIPICAPSSSTTSDRYTVQLIMEGGLRIRKYTDGSASTLRGTSSGGGEYAAHYEVPYSTGRHTVVIEADQGDGIYASVYDSSGSQLAWVRAPNESEYIANTNGFGFRSSGSGRVFFDALRETDIPVSN